jgi:ABC-type dipeptide/oligopeptide/nickel transport system ATPase component
LLGELGVADAAGRMRSYPHEFSGGMRQRVVLAKALIREPELLIADEPTTALDVRVQEQVLSLLDRVARDRALAVLLITHDLGIVAGFVQRAEGAPRRRPLRLHDGRAPVHGRPAGGGAPA